MMDAPFAANWIGDDFEPDIERDAQRAVVPVEASPVSATPFAWGPEADLPTRKWLYGTHLIRGYVSLDVAAGGAGKTALKVGEALAMASGRDLYNKALPAGPLRVWLYNLEDSMEELTIRLRAAAKYHSISEEDIDGRLFVDSGLDQPLIIATATPNGTLIARPKVDALIAEIRARKIDVLTVDPFISSHGVSENDNNAIDAVVKQGWVYIAHQTGCAINLAHHIRKGNGEEADVDSARGASALIGAARSVQVFNRMSEDEALRAEIEPEKRRFHFRVENGKANLAPPAERADWYRMESAELDNGENVGVVRQFIWPSPKAASLFELDAIFAAMAGREWRQSPQCNDWAGHAIGPVFNLDTGDKQQSKKVQNIIRGLVNNGHLRVVMKDDEKGRSKPYLEQNQ